MLNRCHASNREFTNHLILFMVKIKYIDYSKVYMHTAEFFFSNCISVKSQTIQKTM